MIRKAKRQLTIFATIFLGTIAVAEENVPALERWQADPMTVFSADEIAIEDFLWLARPVVIFATSPNDPRFTTQLEELLNAPEDVMERDIVLITDTEPNGKSDLRTELRPRDFHLVLIGKDGQVKLRKPRPWDARELSRVIDKMPMRKRELSAE